MEGFQVRRFGIEIMNGSTSQRFSKKCNGSFRNRNFRTISRGRTTKLTYYIYIYIENQLKWKEVSHHIVLEGSHQIDFMINVLCVYSLKSVHVFFSWSSQRWFRISDSFFPRMFVGTCLTSPGSSPQKIYKPLKENTHHKSFLAVISWKNVDMFLFFVANKIIVFFLFGSFFTSFWFTPGSNMEGFFNTFCSLEIRLFLSNQPGGERPPRRNDASKVGHSILPPRDFLFGTKIPWWVKGEMGVIHSP